MNRWPTLAILPIMALGLAGCSLGPSTSQTAAPAASATPAQVAQAGPTQLPAPTQPVVELRAPSPEHQFTPTAASTRHPSASVPAATAAGSGQSSSPLPLATATRASTLALSTTPAPTGTAVPSATPLPTSTASPSPEPTPVILAPVHLAEAEVGGGTLLPRYWTNTHAVAFSMAAAPGTTAGMRPQVEVVPLAQPYRGVPTASGAALSPDQAGEVIVPVGSLPEGAYHWQGRLADDRGHSGPWIDYYQGPAFRLDRTPPGVPVINSPTHPDQRATYPAAMVEIGWTRPEDAGGIQGYRSSVDRNPAGLPTGPLIAIRKTVFGPLRNGDLYVHVRAEDWAGNLGGVATYALHIDHQAPLLAHAIFDRFQFNPRFDTLGMHVGTDKAVRAEARIRRQSTKGLVRVIDAGLVPANGEIKVAWDGRNQRGIPVQPGLYTLEIYATDRQGNIGDAIYTDLSVNYRRIVVHLAAQSMDVYDGNTLLRSTPVTTGNRALPTPPGIWHIGAKFHPYKFISPWKKGSPYYYPPSPVGYALYFRAGGYFIHDAPWRTDFGPGSNAQPGAPGSGPDAGTHGCVNVPTDVAKWLYNWAATGTVVQIVQ